MDKVLLVANLLMGFTFFTMAKSSEPKNMTDLFTKIEQLIAESATIKRNREKLRIIKNRDISLAEEDEIILEEDIISEKKKAQPATFRSHTSEKSPIHYKFKFDRAVNEKNIDKVITLLTENPELSTNYYPAIFLEGIYKNTITDNFYVDRAQIEPVINIEAFEDVAFALAMQNSNDFFLAECPKNHRLKKKLQSGL